MKPVVAVLIWALAATAVACIDVEGGDSGYYTSPCGGGFASLLLCGRESGGADPVGGGSASGASSGDQPASCASVCELIAACQGITDPAEIAECTGDCSSDPSVTQPLLDCIERAGCNFEACVGG